MMDKCIECGTAMVPSEYLATRTISGCKFERLIPSSACPECGWECIGSAAAKEVSLWISKEFALHGPATGKAFRHMRKTLGMPAIEVAKLLELTPETVSRWESGARPVNHHAFILLGSLVLDRLRGETTTIDRIQALCPGT